MESVNKGRLVITAGMLDENGKAYYGTPGPGSYQPPTAFRKVRSQQGLYYEDPETGYSIGYGHGKDQNDMEEENAGAQVFRSSAAYSMASKPARPEKLFISNMHNQTYGGSESPGPKYLFKNITLKAAPRPAFSTASRNEENKARYISRDHCMDALGQDSPGPSAYKIKSGKGIAKSMGDAPTWAFGTGEQHNDGINPSSRSYPGPGAHNLRPVIGPGSEYTPSYTFAPMGDERLGNMRSRNESQFQFISEQHNKAENGNIRTNPGPDHYFDINLDAVKIHHPVAAFSKNPRHTEKPDRQFISNEHVDPDPASPGPIYAYSDNPVTRHRGTAIFQKSSRLTNPELGGNKGGPFISRAHSQSFAGANSPGPGAYEYKTGKGHTRTLGDCPLSVFGSEARNKIEKELEAARGVPGPGAYMIRNVGSAPGFSMAANLRTDFTAGVDPDEPGPGHYEINTGVAHIHPAVKAPGKTKFGKSKDRSTFITDQPGYSSPGPGTYNPNSKYHDVIDAAPKYSFGAREKRRGGGKSNASYRYIGPLHASAEGYGEDSPGPAQYTLKTGKGHSKTMGDAPTMKFGTGLRANGQVFISDKHNLSMGDTKGERPGPGHYNTSSFACTSKHKNRGGCSFGTAARQFGGTVRF